jgi:hypothetical protein
LCGPFQYHVAPVAHGRLKFPPVSYAFESLGTISTSTIGMTRTMRDVHMRVAGDGRRFIATEE